MPNKKKSVDVGFLREGFGVKRFHTVMHVNIPETVGHHTGNVIALIFFLYEDEPPIEIIRAALHHDAAEFLTGDIPATAKWTFPDIKESIEQAEYAIGKRQGLQLVLSPVNEALLRYADCMDLCFKSVEELATGNELFLPILVNGIRYTQELLLTSLVTHQRARALFEILKSNNYIDIQELNLEKPQNASVQ